jgi:hypothetical protein
MFLRNVGVYQWVYTASQPRRTSWCSFLKSKSRLTKINTEISYIFNSPCTLITTLRSGKCSYLICSSPTIQQYILHDPGRLGAQKHSMEKRHVLTDSPSVITCHDELVSWLTEDMSICIVIVRNNRSQKSRNGFAAQITSLTKVDKVHYKHTII